MKHFLYLVLLLECFYGLNIADYNLMALVFSIPFCFYFIKYLKEDGIKHNNVPHKIICILLLSLICNILSCWFFRDQSPYLSIRTSYIRNFLPILIFYYLYYKKLSIQSIEKVIQILFFIFVFCYILEYFIFYPSNVFNLLSFNDAEKRFRLVGQLILFIGYFYFLNKVLVLKKCPFYYYIGITLGLLCILLLGFRSLLLASIAISLFLIYRIKGFSIKSIKFILLAIILGVIFFQFESVNQSIANMIERQNSGATLDNEDYIRVREWDYFTQKHFDNYVEMFFGSGIPNYDSQYGKYMYSLQEYDKYGQPTSSIAAWFDWGLIGLSWALGIPTSLVLYFLIFYMVFKNRDKRYLYISSVYLFLLLTSITTVEMYRFGAFAFHGILLYLVYQLSLSKNEMKI